MKKLIPPLLVVVMTTILLLVMLGYGLTHDEINPFASNQVRHSNMSAMDYLQSVIQENPDMHVRVVTLNNPPATYEGKVTTVTSQQVCIQPDDVAEPLTCVPQEAIGAVVFLDPFDWVR